jgi:SAM-dependent methyltransferase
VEPLSLEVASNGAMRVAIVVDKKGDLMNPVSILPRIAAKLRTEGLRETLHIIRKNIILERWDFLNRRFDAWHHVDTRGSIQPVDLDIASDNKRFGTRYEPTPVKTFKSTMSNLPTDLSRFVFVDFGSGKGRALLLASEYNFKRIVGVEYAKDLHVIAEQNILSHRNRKQRCFDISSVYCDAAVFPIPDDACVLYFYQPFTLDVMTSVAGNIKKSYVADPREIYLVFLYPHATAIEAVERNLSFAERIQTHPLPRDFAMMYTRELLIYKCCR